MKRLFFLLPLLLAGGSLWAADPAPESPVGVAGLTAEHEKNPLGIGVAQPRLSWKLASDRAGEVQTGYEIRAASTAALLAGVPDLFDTGKVASAESVLVDWPGQALASRGQAWWQVRVWDKDGKASAWSAAASVEMGVLNPAQEWKGQWITVDLPRYDMVQEPLAKANWISAGAAANQALAASLTIDLPADAGVHSAILDANADGLVALYVNGLATKQGASSHTAPFHADFPQQLKPGPNRIGLFSLAVRNSRGGGRNALAAHGAIELEGGKRIEFNTNGDWKAAVVPATGPNTPNSWTFVDATWPAATVLGPYADSKPAASADSTIGPGRYLRKTFTVSKPVAKARLYATALGTYEASINGQAVNDHQLDPGWTDYAKRVMVQTTDATALLKPGQNVLGAVLTDGWFAGRIGWMGLGQYARVSARPLFNAQLVITYADGTMDTIATDGTWQGGPGALAGSDMQLGEVIDARRGAGWNLAGFDDSAWKGAAVQGNIATALVPQLGPPVRKLMEIVPQKIAKINGLYVVDLGQNIVGHVRLKARGAAGAEIVLQHAEMLNADGTIYNENLRQAVALDRFILKGDAAGETFEPRFTFHGFRYVQIAGYPGELTQEAIQGIVVGSDTPDTGTFECSNADINRLWQNIRWGQRGNFLSIPTDCPQRDERMGWMGDAQVFAPTAARNADVSGFFIKWLADVRDGQMADGRFNNVNPVGNQTQSYPVWGDAGVVIPWEMYLAYGDKAFLADNYGAMARWVDYLTRPTVAGFLSTGVGDHLAPSPTPGPAGAAAGLGRGRGGLGAVTTTQVVDNAYFAHSAWILSQAAAILGKPEDAATYDQLFRDRCAAFTRDFVNPTDGTLQAGTQTCYVLALEFNLLPDNLRSPAAKHLTDDIAQRGHLSTGFVGVGLINPALTQSGRSDAAYQLLLTDTYPSWLYTIRQGATTMWERWDGYTPDTGFQASSMNSFNHYSFGSVGLWLYSGAAGMEIDPAKPGYKHFMLRPQLTTSLSYVKATYESPYGRIVSQWRRENDRYLYDATVPPNSSASLTIPVADLDTKVTGDGGFSLNTGGPYTMFYLPPGTYHISFSAAISPSVSGYK